MTNTTLKSILRHLAALGLELEYGHLNKWLSVNQKLLIDNHNESISQIRRSLPKLRVAAECKFKPHTLFLYRISGNP